LDPPENTISETFAARGEPHQPPVTPNRSAALMSSPSIIQRPNINAGGDVSVKQNWHALCARHRGRLREAIPGPRQSAAPWSISFSRAPAPTSSTSPRQPSSSRAFMSGPGLIGLCARYPPSPFSRPPPEQSAPLADCIPAIRPSCANLGKGVTEPPPQAISGFVFRPRSRPLGPALGGNCPPTRCGKTSNLLARIAAAKNHSTTRVVGPCIWREKKKTPRPPLRFFFYFFNPASPEMAAVAVMGKNWRAAPSAPARNERKPSAPERVFPPTNPRFFRRIRRWRKNQAQGKSTGWGSFSAERDCLSNSHPGPKPAAFGVVRSVAVAFQ